MIHPSFQILALLLIAAIAVASDIRTRRIPNALTLGGAVAGLSLQTIAGGLPGLLSSTAGLAAGIAILLPFYLLRGMGAGDVKLMGTVGSFIGAKPVLLAACATLCIGVLLGIAVVIRHRFIAAHSEAGTAPRKAKFPYAVAIAGGGIVALSQHGQLHDLAGLILGWTSP
jgi:Flp pilus assembly protein protease CpaA